MVSSMQLLKKLTNRSNFNSNITSRIDQWKIALNNIDTRFINIEKHLNITTPINIILTVPLPAADLEVPKRPIVNTLELIITVNPQRSARSTASQQQKIPQSTNMH